MNDTLKQQIIESLHKAPHSPGVHQGSRKLKHGLVGKYIPFFHSIKNGLSMPCESRLEADHCLQMEYDDEIAHYRTQPLTIDIGKNQTYTPDCVLCSHHDDYICREIKISGKLESQSLQERLSRIRLILADAGVGFEIVTEKRICVEPDIQNKKFLYRAKRLPFSQFQTEHALALLSLETCALTLRKAWKICSDAGLPKLIVDHALSYGHLNYDNTKLLCADSMIYVPGGAR